MTDNRLRAFSLEIAAMGHAPITRVWSEIVRAVSVRKVLQPGSGTVGAARDCAGLALPRALDDQKRKGVVTMSMDDGRRFSREITLPAGA